MVLDFTARILNIFPLAIKNFGQFLIFSTRLSSDLPSSASNGPGLPGDINVLL